MQISSSTANHNALPINRTKATADSSVLAVRGVREKTKIDSAVANVSTEEKAANKTEQTKTLEKFNVDEQAFQQAQQVLYPQASSSSSQSDFSQNSSKSTAYDEPSEQNHSAVTTYQTINNLAQRDQVQQIFGVDVFA